MDRVQYVLIGRKAWAKAIDLERCTYNTHNTATAILDTSKLLSIRIHTQTHSHVYTRCADADKRRLPYASISECTQNHIANILLAPGETQYRRKEQTAKAEHFMGRHESSHACVLYVYIFGKHILPYIFTHSNARTQHLSLILIIHVIVSVCAMRQPIWIRT